MPPPTAQSKFFPLDWLNNNMSYGHYLQNQQMIHKKSHIQLIISISSHFRSYQDSVYLVQIKASEGMPGIMHQVLYCAAFNTTD